MGDELIAFQESIIESERAWIRDILDEYWYNCILVSLICNQRVLDPFVCYYTQQNISP